MRRSRGFSLLEVVVAMAIFSIFLVIAFSLTSDMRKWEKNLPVNFMRNPQIMSVIARMRRDVLDIQINGEAPTYLNDHDGYKMGEKTLILQTILKDGLHVIVWDFSEPGVARRIAYDVGNKSQWTARGLPPEFSAGVEVDAVKFQDRAYAVRLKAKDSNGQLAIDQILQPRAHQ